MGLIDVDRLKKDLESVTLSNGTLLNTNTVLLLLDKYPTAYDVDKVVGQLEKKIQTEIKAKLHHHISRVISFMFVKHGINTLSAWEKEKAVALQSFTVTGQAWQIQKMQTSLGARPSTCRKKLHVFGLRLRM